MKTKAVLICLMLLALPHVGWAQRAPDPEYAGAPDFDVRGSVANAVPAARREAAGGAPSQALGAMKDDAAAKGADLQVRWSERTGAPSRISSTRGSLTEPSFAPALEVAQSFLQSNLALLNLSAEDVRELRVAREFVTRHNGVTHLTFQQQAHGIDVFGAAIEANVSRDGRVLNLSGEPMADMHAGVNVIVPSITSEEAIARAAGAAGVTDILESVSEGLVYFPLARGSARLAWQVVVRDNRTPNAYRSVVDAVDGTVLWRHNGTRYGHIATHGAVFDRDSPIPDNPIGSSTGTVARVDRLFHGGGQVFPPVLGTPIFPHGDVHFDWWNGAARTVTTSNNVRAQDDRNGDNAGGTQATDNGIDDFTQPLDLTQDPSTYTAAAVTNLFYWVNRIHDIFYKYGFDEASRNYQTANFGLGGLGGDPVIADAQDNRDGTPASICNANFDTTAPEGTSGRMQMFQSGTTSGSCGSPSPERDGDFDNGVIIHEFHHGLGERLRPTLHGGSQGGGMGEGGGDFQALAVLTEPGDDPNGLYALAQFLTSNPNGSFRRAPWSIRPGVFPFTYGDISISGEVHDVGEIWANTLWIARTLLVSRYGFVTGTDTILQLQLDGYKMAPANPDFLDMRDSMILADSVNNGGINECLLWQAFARMGMGVSASSTGNNDTAPVEAFDTPLSCMPRISINPSLVDFGHVPVNPVGTESGVKSVDFNVCNVGTGELYVTNVLRQAPNPAFTIVPPPPGGFPLPISPDFCHTIEVLCNPTAAGPTSATVRIESSDPLNAIITTPVLTCTGAVPAAQVSPDPLSFGNVPTTPAGGEEGFKDRSLKVRNTGTSTLRVTAITSVGGNAGDFTVLTPEPGFPTLIAAGSEFDFQIRCDPSASGLRTTTLRVTSNSGGTAGTTTDVAANCVGTTSDVRITGNPTFGNVCAEDMATQAISVCNVGVSNLQVTGAFFDPPCADFTLVNNPFPAPVSPDFCIDLNIRFTPTSMGPKSCTLKITTNDPDTPIVSVVVTGNTPAPSIDVPPSQAFLPEVIQSAGACSSQLPVPISHPSAACNLTIQSVVVGGTNASDFGLAGLPSSPIILEPGHIVGEGDLRTVFAPTALDRDRLGTLTVTYVSDPVTGATSQVTRNLCGEGVLTGARVLVRAAGVPIPSVERIHLQRLGPNRNKTVLDSIDNVRDVALQTVTPGGSCSPFQFHREYGTVSNPIQLAPGSYQVTVTARVNGRRLSQSVGFDVTTCDFNPTVIVDF